jgi:fumarylpyruvate hydrolase
MSYIFSPNPPSSVEIRGTDKRFPVHRIYCVGQNYGAHAVEMGSDPKREPPFFFSKPADAILESGDILAYPQATENLHHEIELVVALGAGGTGISTAEAKSLIFGYGVGIDFTRRDLQAKAKATGRPWDTAKGFDQSAALGAIVPARDAKITADSGIGLKVNGDFRQQAKLGDMIWSVAETISALSNLYLLRAGDLIYMGTPSGVGAVVPGDTVEGSVQGLGTLVIPIGEAKK